MRPLTGFQQFALIALRIAVGWQFAYEGFYKLMLPGWTRAGVSRTSALRSAIRMRLLVVVIAAIRGPVQMTFAVRAARTRS